MTRACRNCSTAATAGAGRFCRVCGHELPAGYGPAPARPTGRLRRQGAALLRWRPSTGRARIALAAALAAAVAGTGALLWSGNSVFYPPEQPVAAWFDALARRDTTAALDLAGGVGALADDGLATGYTPPADVTIGEVTYGQANDETRRPNRSTAYVAVTYRVGGDLVEASIEVHRDRSGPVRPWSLGAGITAPVDVVSPVVKQARLGGADVRTIAAPRTSGTDGAVWAPPGVYTVTAPTDDPLFGTSPTTVAVHAGQARPDKTTSVALELTALPEAIAQITAQIRAELDTCARSDDLNPSGCPIGYSGLDALGATGITWQITAYPQITLTPADNQYTAGGLADVVTVKPGQATATYTRRGRTETRTVDIAPGGAVRVLAGGELCWNATRSALACGDME